MKNMKKRFLLPVLGASCLALVGFGGATIENASADSTVPTLTMDYGASIRVADDGKNGLRFSATVENPTEGYEYHIVIVPEKYFEQEVYATTEGDVLTKLNAVHKALKNDETATVNDYNCTPDENGVIRACITNIAYTNSNLQFTAIGYVKANGEIVSYAENQTTRSLTWVAAQCLLEPEENYGEEVDAVLNEYLTNGFNYAVGNEQGADRPELSLTVTETATTEGYTADGNVIDYAVSYNGTELPELFGIVAPVSDNVTEKDGKIFLNEDSASGEYTVTLKAPAMDSATVTLEHTNMNLFSAATYDAWEIGAYGSYVSVDYDATEQATVFSGKNNNTGMTSDQNVVGYPIAKLKKAQQDGYAALSFQVKASETLLEKAYFTASNYTQTAGIRIYATAQLPQSSSVRHNYVIWQNDHRSPTVADQGTGVSIYKDVFAVDMSTTEYTQVVVNLAEFLALNESAEYLAFSVGALGADSKIFVKDTKWLTEVENTAYLEVEKAALASKNYVAENMVQRWHLTYGYVTNLDRSYDATEGAMKVSVINDRNSRRDASNHTYLGNVDFKRAQALGFTKVSITYKVNEAKRTSRDAAKAANAKVELGDFLIRSRFNKTSATTSSWSIDSTTEISQLTTESTTQYVTVTVELSKILAQSNAAYVMLDIAGLAGSTVWFKEMKFVA